ncbi:MAG: hypothetical protein ACRD8U_17150, partial [Pyrinomonadaceae bacterium]
PKIAVNQCRIAIGELDSRYEVLPTPLISAAPFTRDEEQEGKHQYQERWNLHWFTTSLRHNGPLRLLPSTNG